MNSVDLYNEGTRRKGGKRVWRRGREREREMRLYVVVDLPSDGR